MIEVFACKVAPSATVIEPLAAVVFVNTTSEPNSKVPFAKDNLPSAAVILILPDCKDKTSVF